MRKILGLGIILIVAGVLVWQYSPRPVEAPVNPPANPSASIASPVAPSSVTPRVAAPRRKSGSHEGAWRGFREEFGSELQGSFLQDGRLASVRGRPGHGEKAGAGFKPDDPQKAIARAREIVDAAHELLGIQAELALESPVARGNAVSAQVFFNEADRDRIPVEPFGKVTVDLDAQGGLIGLYSDYVPNLQVTSGAVMDESQARQKALASFTDLPSGTRAEGGNLVTWVSRGAWNGAENGSAEGRRAYVYAVQGYRIIVDAANGRILAKKDIRQF